MTEEFQELHRALGRIEGQLATVIEMVGTRNARDDARDERVNKRVAAVEKKLAWYSGAAATVGAVVAYFVKH
jgi:hypothetical protein